MVGIIALISTLLFGRALFELIIIGKVYGTVDTSDPEKRSLIKKFIIYTLLFLLFAAGCSKLQDIEKNEREPVKKNKNLDKF